jgi:hypothetical protein
MSRSKNLHSSPPAKSRVIQVCLFLIRLFLLGIVTLVLLIGVAWAFGALWFDFPFSALRRPLATVFGLGAIAALAFVRPRWRAQVAVAGAIALVAIWELTIPPFNTGDWPSEVAEAPYVEIDGDRIVIHNFRNFDYLSKIDSLHQNRCELLADNPAVGRPCDEIRPGLRRMSRAITLCFTGRNPTAF